jgi:hypothetical protein
VANDVQHILNVHNSGQTCIAFKLQQIANAMLEEERGCFVFLSLGFPARWRRRAPAMPFVNACA